MKKTLSLIILILICFSINIAQKKSSAADFLKIGQGARLVGLSEAYTGLSDDANALRGNIAGLANIRFVDIQLTHCDWFDAINSEVLNVTIPLPLLTLGVSGQVLYYAGDVAIYDDWGVAVGAVKAQDMAYKLAAGMPLPKKGNIKWNIGTGISVVNRTVDDVHATMVATEFGVLAHIDTRPVAVGKYDYLFKDGIQIGLIGNNLGTSLDEYNMPMGVKFGISSLIHKGLIISIDLNKALSSRFGVLLGLEYNYKNTIFLRGGYRFMNVTDSFTLGAGFRQQMNSTIKLNLDYALDPHGPFGWTHHITLGISTKPSKKKLNANLYYYEGLNAYVNNDFLTAEKMWKKCLKIDKNHEEAKKRLKELWVIDDIQRQRERLDAYENELQKYLTTDSENSENK